MSIVNGMAHVALSVSNFEGSKNFYKELLPFLGLKLVYDGENSVYHVGARTALLIQKCDQKFSGKKFIFGGAINLLTYLVYPRALMSLLHHWKLTPKFHL